MHKLFYWKLLRIPSEISNNNYYENLITQLRIKLKFLIIKFKLLETKNKKLEVTLTKHFLCVILIRYLFAA